MVESALRRASPPCGGQALPAAGKPAIPDCIELIGGPRLECNPAVVKIYRA